MLEFDIIKQKYEMLRSAMDERLNRIWAASEALAIGWGGATLVAEATGISRGTISAGIRELKELGFVPAVQATPQQPFPRPTRLQGRDRIRRPGGGVKLKVSARAGLFDSCRFVSRSSVRYLFAVLMLPCLSQFAMVLRSTPVLRTVIDFRRIYRGVLEDWLGLPAKAELGGDFERLPLFRA